MTYRSLSDPHAQTNSRPKRSGPEPRGVFKKEEPVYLLYIHHEALRVALDEVWLHTLSSNVRVQPDDSGGLEWWHHDIDEAWLKASPRSMNWAIYFQACAEARRRLEGENKYVTTDPNTLEWREESGGKRATILWEDIDA